MRGRRSPTAVQVAQGDPRKIGKRKLAEKLASEPSATRGLPDCPSYLNGRARAAWGFWAAELADMNLDKRPDAMMLEGACVAYAAARECEELIAQQGRFIAKRAVDKKTGDLVVIDVKTHPACVQANVAWSLMRSFCGEFGLSPVSRTRLSVDTSETEDLMEILTRPRASRAIVQ